jgi:N-formylmaleamate deformylase
MRVSNGKKRDMKNFTGFLVLILILTTASVQAQSKVYEVKVTGKGSPLLFIPHIGCSGDMWQDAVKELSKTHECHVFSLAGFAGLAPLDSNYTQQYKTAINDYIQVKKLKNVTVIGMNYGGFIALQLAAEPTRIARLIVIDTYPFLAQIINPAITQEQANTFAGNVKTAYLGPDKNAFHAMMYQLGKNMITHDTLKAKLYADWNVASDRKTIATALADQMATDLRPVLPAIKIPVLCFGTWYFGKTMKKMPLEEGYTMHDNFYASLTNHSVKLTETAKDFIHWDDSQWFIKEVNQFIQK